MNEVDFSQSVVVPDDTLFREIDGESVILSLKTQAYYGLDSVGTRMWNLLAASASIQAAYEQLLEEYEVAPADLRSDLSELIGSLLEQKLVRIGSSREMH
jgi:hypothetical protein